MLFAAKVCAAGLAAALAAGLTAPAAVAAPSDDHRAAATDVSLGTNRFKVLSGNRVELDGQVHPGKKGMVVVLQKLPRGATKWVTEARLKTARAGGFRYVDKPRTVGVRHYRVVVPKTAEHERIVSNVSRVTVYRWLRLHDVIRLEDSATRATKTVRISGRTYTPAFVGDGYSDAGFVDWNLRRACLRLQARLGNNDDSDGQAVAAVSLVADGTTRYSRSFRPAQSEMTTVRISGVLRFGFHWTASRPADPTGYQVGSAATLAEPRVLCSF